MNKTKAFVAAVGIGLLGAAVATELRKPAWERTWEGSVGGVIPYDLRPPTLDRLQERVWNPEGPVFPPHAFGVGWSINLGRIARELGVR